MNKLAVAALGVRAVALCVIVLLCSCKKPEQLATLFCGFVLPAGLDQDNIDYAYVLDLNNDIVKLAYELPGNYLLFANVPFIKSDLAFTWEAEYTDVQEKKHHQYIVDRTTLHMTMTNLKKNGEPMGLHCCLQRQQL